VIERVLKKDALMRGNRSKGIQVLSNASECRNGKVWACLSKEFEVGEDRHLWEFPGGAFF